MKLILLHQLDNPNHSPLLASELWVNKDIIRWAYLTSGKSMNYTKLTLIADDKPLNILETPEEINNLCNFIQEVRVIGMEDDGDFENAH